MFKKIYFNLCKKVWSKFSLSLPLWRHLHEQYSKEIQSALDWQHTTRDIIDKVYGVDYTTFQAFLHRNACVGLYPDKFPLITPKSRSYFRGIL